MKHRLKRLFDTGARVDSMRLSCALNKGENDAILDSLYADVLPSRRGSAEVDVVSTGFLCCNWEFASGMRKSSLHCCGYKTSGQ